MPMKEEWTLPELSEYLGTVAEDCEEESDAERLERRLDILEQRLDRSLLGIDDCRGGLEELQELYRHHLLQEQAASLRRRKRRRSVLRWAATVLLGAAFLLQAKALGRFGWKVLAWIARAVELGAEQIAGLLALAAPAALLWLLRSAGRKKDEAEEE